MTHSNAVKARIISLRKSGLNRYRISEKLNIPRPTVSRLLIKNGLGSYKLTDVQTENLNEEFLGEFLGIFAADGNCYQSFYKSGHKFIVRLYFSGDEKGYAKEVRKLLNKLFTKCPHLYENVDYNVVIIRYNSKKLIAFIKNYLRWGENKTETISLKSLSHSKKFLAGFLRGFLDSDGCTDKNYKRVSMFCISKNMMSQIYKISKSFGFKPSVYIRRDKLKKRKDLHFVILTKEDAKKFINFVKPRNLKRVPEWARSHRHD